MTERDVAFEKAVHGVVQGYPGAFQVLHGLRETLPFEDFQTIVEHLYEHGPRGSNLWERYNDRCEKDALVLGRDLLAIAGEWKGWNEAEPA